MQEGTHSDIIAKIASLEATVTAKMDGLAAGYARHTQQIDAIHDRLASGQVVLGKIEDMRIEFTRELKAMETRQSEDREEIKALLAANNQRIGRDGVWAALLRSPLFGWFAGLATAVGAWIGIGKVS